MNAWLWVALVAFALPCAWGLWVLVRAHFRETGIEPRWYDVVLYVLAGWMASHWLAWLPLCRRLAAKRLRAMPAEGQSTRSEDARST
jgi:hypothetical protein